MQLLHGTYISRSKLRALQLNIMGENKSKMGWSNIAIAILPGLLQYSVLHAPTLHLNDCGSYVAYGMCDQLDY